MIDCYRDPSVLQHVAINLSDTWHDLKNGQPCIHAASHILDSRNLDSLRALWQERHWIRHV